MIRHLSILRHRGTRKNLNRKFSTFARQNVILRLSHYNSKLWWRFADRLLSRSRNASGSHIHCEVRSALDALYRPSLSYYRLHLRCSKWTVRPLMSPTPLNLRRLIRDESMGISSPWPAQTRFSAATKSPEYHAIGWRSRAESCVMGVPQSGRALPYFASFSSLVSAIAASGLSALPSAVSRVSSLAARLSLRRTARRSCVVVSVNSRANPCRANAASA